MKVTGETFSSILKEENHRRGKIPKVSKLSGKRTVTGQNSGELYTKRHRRGNSYALGKPIQNLLKELFPNYTGRIFQVKGQSKNSNTTIFILSFFNLKIYIQ